MKNTLLTLAVAICIASCGSGGEKFETIKTCEEGSSRAIQDLADGKLRYIFGTYGANQPLAKNLKNNYGIEVIEVDGFLGIPNKCYNDEMYVEIQKRFGNDIFEKAFD